jgi:hypothetical protein
VREQQIVAAVECVVLHGAIVHAEQVSERCRCKPMTVQLVNVDLYPSVTTI